MLNMINGEVNATIDAFIIPNKGGTVNEFLFDIERKKEYFQKLAALNEYEYDENDTLVQLWFVETGDGDGICDNMCDHKFNIKDRNDTYICNIQVPYLPYKLIQNKMEDDAMELKIPVYAYRYERDRKLKRIELEIMINATITFRQQKYRYSSFGAFEEVLQQVV